MLNLFGDAAPSRLARAIERGDAKVLGKLLAKTDSELLKAPIRDGRHAAEFAICRQQPLALSSLLRAGADANARDRDGQPLLCLALQQPEQSLALISALLQAGADPNNRDRAGSPLLHLCFEYCAQSRLMLHLSRLIEAGGAVDCQDPAGLCLLDRALRSGQRELIHFLIHSGAALPTPLPADVPGATLDYARKCAEDYRIRQQFLAP